MNPYSGLGILLSYSATPLMNYDLSDLRSLGTDSDLDHPKGMHPKVSVSLVFSSV